MLNAWTIAIRGKMPHIPSDEIVCPGSINTVHRHIIVRIACEPGLAHRDNNTSVFLCEFEGLLLKVFAALKFWPLQLACWMPSRSRLCCYLLPIAGVICFLRLSPLAAIAKLRSRSFSNILIFSEKLSEASPFRIRSLLKFFSKIAFTVSASCQILNHFERPAKFRFTRGWHSAR